MQASMTGSAMSINRILLSTDFSAASQTAFRVALCICADLRASLLILHVFENVNASSRIGNKFVELESVDKANRSSLDNLREVAERSGVVCGTIMIPAPPSLSVMQTISPQHIYLI